MHVEHTHPTVAQRIGTERGLQAHSPYSSSAWVRPRIGVRWATVPLR